MLHWSAFFGSVASSWISQDIDPTGATVAQTATQPIVNTQGALADGVTGSLALASLANVNLLGGYPDMNEGTYHGLVIVSDLADPQRVVAVPAKLILGDGTHTPTVVAAPSTIAVSAAPNSVGLTNLVLRDGAKTCGYAYSVSSDMPWAIVGPDQRVGAVGLGPSATGTVPIRIDTSGMVPGTYHGTITIQTVNAEPNPVKVPICPTVKPVGTEVIGNPP